MKTPLLFASSLLALGSMAQDIPTDVIGDVGWTLFWTDTMPLVRAADGHAWTLMNLGADHVADTTHDAGAVGGRYQWGRWTDGHEEAGSPALAASNLAYNNPTGLSGGSVNFYFGPDPNGWWAAGSSVDSWAGNVLSAENGMDPCLPLGPGWYLPSESDWSALVTAEGITNTVTAFASNLRLPVTGHRDGQTAGLTGAGLYGQYWSNTPSGAYAKDLTIGDTWVNPSDDAYRSHGMCVRCLNKNIHAGISPVPTASLQILQEVGANLFTVMANAGGIERIDVFAADGRLVRTVPGNPDRTTVAMNDVPDGLYIVIATTASGVARGTVLLAQ